MQNPFSWLIGCLLLIGFHTCAAQSFYQPEEHAFALKVKQIDEFFERFNGDTNTLVSKYMLKHFPDEPMNRMALLSTLFPRKEQILDTNAVKYFVGDILEMDTASYLSYYDQEWFAKVFCELNYRDSVHTAILTLKVESDTSLASEWVICGVEADFLRLPEADTPSASLNPVSHATDFMNIDQVFSNRKFIRGYLHRNFRAAQLSLFVRELNAGLITYNKIHAIEYHFLQLDRWSFHVERYPRGGWQIGSLQKMTKKEKDDYRKNVLFLDPIHP
ncbi:MAG: hypothetical protein AAF206_06675 [Bacteroidota bacterium]